MIPFIFSSLAIAAVGRAAMDMVNEVRRQFREIPGIMDYTAKPEYEKCVAISTKASIREMLAPGAIALLVPLLVGFGFKGVFANVSSAEILGGLLAGVTVSGVLMGIFQSNAGGAWDNAKKSFEKGAMVNGKMEYKGSEAHKASVTGDTVGDPFKDTSGPSMNILIKLMSIVSLVIAPHIAVVGSKEAKSTEVMDAKISEAVPALTSLSGVYQLDPSHSFVEFSLRNLLSTAKGNIKLDSGKVMIDSGVVGSKLELYLDASSVNTMNENRDAKLKTETYLDATKYHSIVFKSEKMEEIVGGEYKYKASGPITVKGVTKAAEIMFNYLGVSDTKSGAKIYSFEGMSEISRNDFGIGKDNVSLGEKIKINFSVDANQ